MPRRARQARRRLRTGPGILHLGGTWEVTVWDEPSFFEWRQKSSGVTFVAGHRVDVLDEARSRLTLSLDMRGLVISITGRLFKDLTNRYMTLEAEGMKRAAESTRT